jgi:hypothetical protein
VLVGDIRDQAQLYGLLDRLQEFGIELLAVEPADGSGGCEPGTGSVVSGLHERRPALVKDPAQPAPSGLVRLLIRLAAPTMRSPAGRPHGRRAGRHAGTLDVPAFPAAPWDW